VTWLHGVVQTIGEQHHQQRIGIIGNCMIGTIPLALFDLPQVGAGGGPTCAAHALLVVHGSGRGIARSVD